MLIQERIEKKESILKLYVKVDEEVKEIYQLTLYRSPQGVYDAIILAVGHQSYRNMDMNKFHNGESQKTVLFDIKGVSKNYNSVIYLHL